MLKKLFKFNKILFAAPLMTLMFCFNAPKNDDEKMHIIMINVKNALAHVHYQPKPINDAYSREVYKNYFETIDPAKDISCSRIWMSLKNTKTSLTTISIMGIWFSTNRP